MTLRRSQVGQSCYVLGTVVVSGNPGALAFGGEVTRMGTLALGLLLVVLSCVCLSSISKNEVLLVFVASSPLPLIELLVRVQHETASDNALTFRLICYLYYISGTLIAISLRKGDAPRNTFLISTIIACVLSLAYLVSLSATQLSPGRQSIDDEALHPVGIAYSFGLVVVTALGICFSVTANLVKLFCFFAMISALACVLFTGSRGAILSLFITGGLYFLVRIRFGRELVTYTQLRRVITIACGALVLISLGFVFRETVEPQLEFIASRFTRTFDTGYDPAMEARAQLRNDYFDNLDEWWLFGYYRYDGTYPHNIALEAWIRFGLFGFVLFGGIVAAILKLLSMARLSPGSAILSVITLQGLFTFINAQTSLSLEFERTLWGACGTGLTLLLIGKVKQARGTEYAGGFLGRAG